MILSSKKEKVMMEELKQKGASQVTTLAVTLVLLSMVVAVCVYGLNDRKLMAANIENAIAKGIDPLTVRCSYARDYDTICIAHAAASGRKF
jgi:hypothetical protein